MRICRFPKGQTLAPKLSDLAEMWLECVQITQSHPKSQATLRTHSKTPVYSPNCDINESNTTRYNKKKSYHTVSGWELFCAGASTYVLTIVPSRLEVDSKIIITTFRTNTNDIGDIKDILPEFIIDPGNWMTCQRLNESSENNRYSSKKTNNICDRIESKEDKNGLA